MTTMLVDPAHWRLWMILLLVCSGTQVQAGQDVLQLDNSNFTQHVLNVDGLALVEFYTPTCSACIAFASEYAKVATSLQLFAPERKPNPYTGGSMKDMHDFAGMLTAREVSKAATALLHDRHITRIGSAAEADAFLAQDAALAKVLLFTDKRAPTTLYKGLSCRFRGRLLFGEVHRDVDAVVARYGVEAFPTLLVVKNDSSIQHHKGELKGLPLNQFLQSFAAEAAPPAAGDSTSAASAGAGMKDSASNSGIRAINILPELCLAELSEADEQEPMKLVAFYASQDDACASQLEELAKFLGDLQGAVPLGRVNTTGYDRQQLARYGLDWGALDADGCSAQLVLLPFGEDKQELDEYARWEGGLTSAKELQQWLFSRMPDLTLQISGPEALQMFMAAGSSAAAGAKAGKVLLLSSKQEAPAAFKALAVGMAGKARLSFGWIAPGSAFADKAKVDFKASKVPHLVSIVPYAGKDVPKSAKGEHSLALQAYPGPLKYPYMMMWLMELAYVAGLTEGDSAKHREDGDGDYDGAPTGTLEVVSTQTEFEQHCTSQAGICILGLLDAASADHTDHVATLKEAAAQHEGHPLHFVQVDAARQPTLLASLGVSSHQLPLVAALSAKRLRFAVSQPPFTTQSIAALLRGVLSGKAVTAPLQELPSIVDGGGPRADEGGAGGMEQEQEGEVVEEEEFDLADILAEDVEQKLPTKEEQLQQVEEQLRAEAEAQRAAEAAAAASRKSSKRKKKKRMNKRKAQQKDEL